MKYSLLAFSLISFVPIVSAGEADFSQQPVAPTVASSDDWEFKFSVYMPMVGLDGTSRVGPSVVPVDLGFDDILDNMDAGVMLAGEARKGKWSVTGDFIWLKMSTSVTPGPATYVGTTLEQTVGSLAFGYEVHEDDCWTVDLLAGGAYTGLDIASDITSVPVAGGGGTAVVGGSEDWVDPFVGVRFRYRAGDHWRFFGRVDYGGWGVASDTYLQAILGAGYELSEHVGVFAAYRFLSVDYDRGNFAYDVETTGPQLGLVFSF
ncbi:MAG: hypothetical protein ACQKBU_01450 [Verrucomicrobiales bacterium]